jgi:hypothetical protein
MAGLGGLLVTGASGSAASGKCAAIYLTVSSRPPTSAPSTVTSGDDAHGLLSVWSAG